MGFLLTRTTRTRQRWRDGEGALDSCLHRDVAAINKMHFRCERYRVATTPHKNKPNRRSRPNKHCLALPVSARTSGRCRRASQWTVRGDAGSPKVRGGSADGCGHAFASLGRLGDGGTLAGKRPPHKPRSDHNKTRQRPARPCSKKRRGGATPAPFCCPSTKEMDADLDLCGGIYPKGARHNGLLCEPEGRDFTGAHALHKTPLCWMPPHTATGAADNAFTALRGGAARSGYPCTSSLRTASD